MARVKPITEDASNTHIQAKQVAPEEKVKKRHRRTSNLHESADLTSPTAARTFQSASSTSESETNCFSTGRHLRHHSVEQHDTKLRLRKPSVDLDATNSTIHASVSERAPRSDVIKTYYTRSRSRSTGEPNNIASSRHGKRHPANSENIPTRRHARSIRRPYKDAVRHASSFGKKRMRELKLVCLGSSVAAWILVIYFLLSFSVLLLGAISWVLTTADQVAMVSCQSSWLHPKCEIACAYSLWPGRYVFPTTCSYRSARSNITIEPEWTIDGVYDLPRLLEKESTECMSQNADFRAIGYETLLMSPEEKDAVMAAHSELCSAFGNMARDLRQYYADVNIFSESILQQPNIANAGAESPSATNSEVQDMDDETVSSFISYWKHEYNLLVTLGIAFADDIDRDRQVLNIIHTRGSEAREQAAGARHDVTNKWPLIRRVCNDVGLLPSEPPEIWRYHDTLEVLDPWLAATSTQESLLARVWSNVTAIHEDLDAQVAAHFSAAALSFFGPAAALSVDSWLMEIRETAQRTYHRSSLRESCKRMCHL